ncbi:unnamed protein product [Brassica oleracea]
MTIVLKLTKRERERERECVLFLFSIEFDRDDELFATAGVSRCIKVFDFSSVRTFRGHTNEKNFEIARPVTSHIFGTPEMDNAEEEAGSYFISAVCWKSDSPTMLTANSQGTIKVLVLAA